MASWPLVGLADDRPAGVGGHVLDDLPDDQGVIGDKQCLGHGFGSWGWWDSLRDASRVLSKGARRPAGALDGHRSVAAVEFDAAAVGSADILPEDRECWHSAARTRRPSTLASPICNGPEPPNMLAPPANLAVKPQPGRPRCLSEDVQHAAEPPVSANLPACRSVRPTRAGRCAPSPPSCGSGDRGTRATHEPTMAFILLRRSGKRRLAHADQLRWSRELAGCRNAS